MMTNRVFLCLPAMTLVTGCAMPQRSVKYSEVDKGKITSFSTPADLRLAFMRPKDDTSKVPIYCAEPVPDVALGSDVSASGSLAASNAMSSAASVNSALAQENEQLRDQLNKAIDAYERDTHQQYKTTLSSNYGASTQASASQSLNLAAAARLAVTVSELGGRSQQVLLAREFLYRLCEARANQFITEPKDYMALQAAALEMIRGIYASEHTSTEAENISATADLVKQVNDYNSKQTALCDAQFKACEAAAANDAEKTKCKVTDSTCLNGIKSLAMPALPVDLGGKPADKPKNLIEILKSANTSLSSKP